MSNQKYRPAKPKSKSSKSTVTWLSVAAVAVVAAIVGGIIGMAPPPLAPDDADVVVYKTATCGCCKEWVDHLREQNLRVSVVNVRETRSVQQRLGVPATLGSCHTAKVGDYFVEGHVPADLVQQLLVEQPENLRGIAVPGMPIGSPGMEGPNPVAYDVVSVDLEGDVAVYATRQGQTAD
tara:strand:- start:186 stop:722 length:537 start_codon:yes stop_codon:yes gene_type:complete